MKALSASEFASKVDALSPPTVATVVHLSRPDAGGTGSLDELNSMLPFLPVDDARGSGSIDLEGSDNWLAITLAVCRHYGDEAAGPYRERCKDCAS